MRELLLLPRHLQDQHQQLLRTVEGIRRETKGELQRHTAAIDLKVGALSQAFVSESRRELEALYSFKRFALTTASVVAGVLFLEILFLAWISVRAVNRLASRVTVWLSEQTSFTSTTAVLGVSGADLFPGNLIEETNLRLQNSIDQLSRRLLELEETATRFHTAVIKPPPVPTLTAPSPQPPPLAPRPRKASGVALTVGDGESLIFLPHDKDIARLRTCRTIIQKLRRTFHLVGIVKSH